MINKRRKQLELYIADQKCKKEEAERLRSDLDIEETLYLRNKRKKMKATDFDSLKVIGRGAFGEVAFTLNVSGAIGDYERLRRGLCHEKVTERRYASKESSSSCSG